MKAGMAIHGRILLVILLISSSCANGGENGQLPLTNSRNKARTDADQYGRRTARKIANHGHANRNNVPVLIDRFNYNPVFQPTSRHLSPSPTPASFANSEYVLGRNAQLNNLFRFQPITITTPRPSASTPKPTTAQKPFFRFGEAQDPRIVWNWLLSNTPSRTTAPVKQKLASPLFLSTNSALPANREPTRSPSRVSVSDSDGGYRYSYVSSTPAPSLSSQKSHPSVVVYHQDLQSEHFPEYLATPGSLELQSVTSAPAEPIGDDYVIATTAKPYIETDLRENFRPYLSPDQLEDYKDGYSYEQNSIAVSTTQPTPQYFQERTTATPFSAISALPRPFRKKIHHPTQKKTSRVEQTSPRYTNPLFRESFRSVESRRNTELDYSPLDVAAAVPQASTVSYVGEEYYKIDPKEDYARKIQPVPKPKISDYEEGIRANEIESNSGEYGRPGYDYPYHRDFGYGKKEFSSAPGGINAIIDPQTAVNPPDDVSGDSSSGNGDDYDSNPSANPPGAVQHQFPVYGAIPSTSFNCSHQLYKGPFADIDTGCQVWHYCDLDGRQSSFLCPNGTLFDQRSYTCDWWYNVRCGQSAQLYALNERLFKYRVDEPPQFPFDYHGPQVDQYILQQYLKNLQEMRKKLWGEEGRRARIKEKLREQKRQELIRKLKLELDEETYEKYGFLLRRRRELP